MKTKLTALGILFLMTFRVCAQNGATSQSGHNPTAPLPTAVMHSNDPVTPQDGNATLGPIFHSTACGLNYVTTSQKLGQRFFPLGVPQPANFQLSIPAPCNPLIQPVILKAYVFAGGSGNGVAVSVSITNPASVTSSYPMTIIGTDVDKCWSYAGTYSYRADVTAAITGSGSYIMSGFPTNPPTSGNDLDGATLMVIYADPQATYEGTIDLWDGCAVGIGNSITQTINTFNACMNGSNARAFAIVGDLQNVGTQFQFNNGPLFSYPLEDWWNFIDEPTTITSGQTTAPFSVISTGDCFNFQMMGVYYQTTCLGCIPVPSDTITCSSTPSTCTASNGSATAVISGNNGPYTYLWNPTGQNTQTATNLPPGLYTVTIVDGSGCTSQDTISVMGTGSLGGTTSQTNVICYGASTGQAIILPVGGSGPFTYVWTPNISTNDTASGLPAGTYTVDVSDNFGCANTFSYTITQPPLVPILGSIAGLSPVCLGYSSTLTASATGGAPPYSYAWISPASVSTTVTITPSVTTTYTVVIADACFTPPDTATFTVTVNQPPVISLAGDDTAACAPHCVLFTAQSNPALASSNWNFGDNSVGSGSPVSHCYYNSGQYPITLYVVDVNGCKDSVTALNYITIYPNPTAGFNFISANPSTILEANILIDDLSQGGDTCYWDFGDGNLLTVVGCGDVSNNYADTGVYHVQQIVVNNGGCADTIEYDVYIVPYTTLYIPNAFTPNGNGSNDIFFIYGEFVDNFHLMIFDRWGNLIFESNDQQKGWDGKANGGKNVAQTDTYVYVLTYSEHLSARKRKVVGHVNLVR